MVNFIWSIFEIFKNLGQIVNFEDLSEIKEMKVGVKV